VHCIYHAYGEGETGGQGDEETRGQGDWGGPGDEDRNGVMECWRDGETKRLIDGEMNNRSWENKKNDS
jgi:hypothetical protein